MPAPFSPVHKARKFSAVLGTMSMGAMIPWWHDVVVMVAVVVVVVVVRENASDTAVAVACGPIASGS